MEHDEVQVTLKRVVFDNLLVEIEHHADNIGGGWKEARDQFRTALKENTHDLAALEQAEKQIAEARADWDSAAPLRDCQVRAADRLERLERAEAALQAERDRILSRLSDPDVVEAAWRADRDVRGSSFSELEPVRAALQAAATQIVRADDTNQGENR